MSNIEHHEETDPLLESDPLNLEWSNQAESVSLRMRIDGTLSQRIAPTAQEKANQVLGEMGHLLSTVLVNQELFRAEGADLEQTFDTINAQIIYITHFLADIVAGREVEENVAQDEQLEEEEIDPRHFYLAYIFDQTQNRDRDIDVIGKEAKRLGYPVRYWWLSQAMNLGDSPDRLIICVNTHSASSDAGMDLYYALKNNQVSWDELEAASWAEYLQLGKFIQGLEDIHLPDGTLLASHVDPAVIEWSIPEEGIEASVRIDNQRLNTLSQNTREHMQLALGRLTLLFEMLLTTRDEEFHKAEISLDNSFKTIASLLLDMTTLYQMMLGKLDPTNEEVPF